MSDPQTPTGARAPRRRWLIVFLVAALAVATAIVWTAFRDHPAEAAVKDFFEALRADDAEAALNLADGEVDASFLVPEAVNFPWDTPEVELIESDGSKATVAVVVETDAGSERAEYDVWKYDDGWRLDHPFVSVTFSWVPVNYGQVNDVLVPFEHLPVEGYTNPGLTFDLFPGEYDFYQSVPEIVAINSDLPSVLLDPSEQPMSIDGFETEFEPEALAEVQAQVDEMVAACLEDTEPKLDSEGCPFWLYDGIFNADGEELWGFSDLQWSIDGPVTVAIGPYDPNGWHWFPVESEIDGEPVSVTGTGHLSHSGTETISTTCALDFSDWSVRLAYRDGAVALAVDSDAIATSTAPSTCGTEL